MDKICAIKIITDYPQLFTTLFIANYFYPPLQ